MNVGAGVPRPYLFASLVSSLTKDKDVSQETNIQRINVPLVPPIGGTDPTETSTLTGQSRSKAGWQADRVFLRSVRACSCAFQKHQPQGQIRQADALQVATWVSDSTFFSFSVL